MHSYKRDVKYLTLIYCVLLLTLGVIIPLSLWLSGVPWEFCLLTFVLISTSLTWFWLYTTEAFRQIWGEDDPLIGLIYTGPKRTILMDRRSSFRRWLTKHVEWSLERGYTRRR